MAIKNEAEEMIKKALMEAVKKLADEKIPKQVPRALVDGVLSEVEELLEDVHIMK
jgi:hypothetical protein